MAFSLFLYITARRKECYLSHQLKHVHCFQYLFILVKAFVIKYLIRGLLVFLLSDNIGTVCSPELCSYVFNQTHYSVPFE